MRGLRRLAAMGCAVAFVPLPAAAQDAPGQPAPFFLEEGPVEIPRAGGATVHLVNPASEPVAVELLTTGFDGRLSAAFGGDTVAARTSAAIELSVSGRPRERSGQLVAVVAGKDLRLDLTLEPLAPLPDQLAMPSVYRWPFERDVRTPVGLEGLGEAGSGRAAGVLVSGRGDVAEVLADGDGYRVGGMDAAGRYEGLVLLPGRDTPVTLVAFARLHWVVALLVLALAIGLLSALERWANVDEPVAYLYRRVRSLQRQAEEERARIAAECPTYKDGAPWLPTIVGTRERPGALLIVEAGIAQRLDDTPPSRRPEWAASDAPLQEATALLRRYQALLEACKELSQALEGKAGDTAHALLDGRVLEHEAELDRYAGLVADGLKRLAPPAPVAAAVAAPAPAVPSAVSAPSASRGAVPVRRRRSSRLAVAAAVGVTLLAGVVMLSPLLGPAAMLAPEGDGDFWMGEPSGADGAPAPPAAPADPETDGGVPGRFVLAGVVFTAGLVLCAVLGARPLRRWWRRRRADRATPDGMLRRLRRRQRGYGLLTSVVVIASGMLAVYLPQEAFGSPRDYLTLLLWGAGVGEAIKIGRRFVLR